MKQATDQPKATNQVANQLATLSRMPLVPKGIGIRNEPWNYGFCRNPCVVCSAYAWYSQLQGIESVKQWTSVVPKGILLTDSSGFLGAQQLKLAEASYHGSRNGNWFTCRWPPRPPHRGPAVDDRGTAVVKATNQKHQKLFEIPWVCSQTYC